MSDSILNDLGRIQKDPVSLRRIFLILTRNHFSNSEHFGRVPEEFKRFVFTDDPKTNELKITLDYIYDDKVVEKRPAIYVGLEDFQFGRKVLDDFVQSKPDNSGNRYHNAVETSVRIRHVSPSPDESLQLGVVSSAFYLGIQKLLVDKLSLDLCRVVGLSKPAMVKNGADRHYRCDLIIQLQFQHIWETTIESHRIKKFKFDIDTV